jgi:hypothetical protein
MTRVGHAWLTIMAGACLAGACLAVGCSGPTPRDMYFGTDAGADFDVPARSTDTGVDTSGAAGQAGATAGAAGSTAGAAGSTAGATGAAGSAGGATTDASPDTDSDGGPG